MGSFQKKVETTSMAPLKVRILGSGKAAEKQRAAFAQLPRRYEVVPDGRNSDITSICTPHFKHYEQVMNALEYGHVFVEKPMAASLWQCDMIMMKERDTGNYVFPVFQYRYSDHSPIDDSVVLELKRDRDYWERGWRSRWDESLGGTVVMHGSHALDLIVEKYGMPHAVNANIWGAPRLKVETRAIIAMQWPTGEICTVGIAADADAGLNEEPSIWQLGDSHTGYIRFFESVWYALNPVSDAADPPPVVPLSQDGRNQVELLTGIYRSFLYGRWTPLPASPGTELYDHGWVELMKAWYGQPEPLSQSCH